MVTQVAEEGASDLHISVGRHPVLRVSGQLISLTKRPILTAADTAGLTEAMMSKAWYQEFLQQKERDFSYSFKDKIRFRVNAFFQKGYIGAAMRIVPYKIKTVEELNLPPVKIHCSVLAEDAIRAAIADWKKKQAKNHGD